MALNQIIWNIVTLKSQDFLKFIGIHALLCNYGGYYGLKALYGQSLKLNLYNMQFRHHWLIEKEDQKILIEYW